MKKLIIIVSALIVGVLIFNFAYFELGWYIDFQRNKPIESSVRAKDKEIQLLHDGEWESFTVKGVNMSTSVPGKWSTEFAVDEATYVRWFSYMQEMGANTLRVYTIQSDDFYNAFYRYNESREEKGEEPLYLMHGVWVNDYAINSHMDAYDDKFKEELLRDCRSMIDVIHGRKTISVLHKASQGTGTYRKDVSKWVIGYILGVEWESDIVIYTDLLYEEKARYKGKYMCAADNATPFESLLAEIGDKTVAYESEKYKTQKLIAIANWCTTDPFKYSVDTTAFYNKMAYVDAERILATENMITGRFASYHVYPYYPDYLYVREMERKSMEDGKLVELSENSYQYLKYKLEMTDAPDIEKYLTEADFTDHLGRKNTYVAYLTALNRYHTMPVVISEFGVPTGRGVAQLDPLTGRDQGHLSEQEQGQAIIECWEDIMQAGCSGGCVYSWQDEWSKRTWNTKHAIDLDRTTFWSDVQTNEQYFGLLAFDTGKERSACYVDGDASEWSERDIVSKNEKGSLSVKYDERYMYFMIRKEGLDFENETICIPLDTTQKTGSVYCSGNGLKFMRPCDFLLTVNGKDNTRLQVQKRYEALRSTYGDYVYHINPYETRNVPDKDTPEFVNIDMILQKDTVRLGEWEDDGAGRAEVFETGHLTYGNANPKSEDFNSLADFMHRGDCIEIRIPWQLLNFADPSKMMIHDDYYDDNYGIEYISIKKMYVGLSFGIGEERIPMDSVALKGWGDKVTYHERLKASYCILKDYWTNH